MIDDLPQVDTIELPEIADCDTSESESADGDLGESANGDRSPDTLQKWRSHPNFVMGMRMAELATMWYVNGWAQSHWPEFMAWGRRRIAWVT